MSNCIPSGVFFGKTIRHQEFSGFRLSETHYPVGLEIPQHAHADANFCFVLRGSYAEVYEGRSRTCVPSTLIFHPSGEVHSGKHDPVEVRLLCIEVEAARLEAVREHSAVLDTPADYSGGLVTEIAARLCREFRQNDGVAALAIEGLILEIMAEASRRQVRAADRQPPRWLGEVRDLLRSRYADPLTLGEVAAAAGVHPVHLAREFRCHYGGTVADSVRGLRIEAACHRLSETHEPLGEIANSLGFADQSHFTRTFKRLIGVTPAQYRRDAAFR